MYLHKLYPRYSTGFGERESRATLPWAWGASDIRLYFNQHYTYAPGAFCYALSTAGTSTATGQESSTLEVHRIWIRIRPDPKISGSGKIRIWPDPNSLDPVNRIHYHVVVPITVSRHCVLYPMSNKKQVTNCSSNASSVHVSYILLWVIRSQYWIMFDICCEVSVKFLNK